MSSSTKKKILPPPTFKLPNDTTDNDLGSDRYELWSIRIPQSIDPMSLNGTSISFPVNEGTKKNKHQPKSSSSSQVSAFKLSNSRMGLVEGNALEMENVRLLLPSNPTDAEILPLEDGDSENESDMLNPSKREHVMIPIKKTIQRHFHLIPDHFDEGNASKDKDVKTKKEAVPPPLHVPSGTQYEGIVASSSSSSSSSIDVVKQLNMKIAYAPKDQVQGLVRRWRPLGAGTSVKWDPSLNQISTPSVISNDEMKVSSPISSKKKKKRSSSSGKGDKEKSSSKKQKKEKKQKKVKKEKN